MFVVLFAAVSAIPPRPLVIKKTPLKLPPNDNGVGCTICTELVRVVEDYLKDGKTQAEIEALLDGYCAKLSEPYSTLCKSLVDNYIPYIISFIEQEIEAFDICVKLGLCTEASRKTTIRIPKGASNDIICETCKQVVSYVEALLASQTTKDKIIELLEELCNKIPAPYGAICDTLVETYLDQIIAWIEQEIEAFDICKKIGLCTDALKIRIPKGASNDIVCETCKQLVNYVESLIDSQTTKDKIIELCEELCNKIPAPYGAICDSLVETYISQIIDWIEQEIEAFDICKKIGLCTDALKIRIPKGAKNDIVCETCQQLVKYVEKLIDSQTTKDKIIELCEELCDKIPAPYGSICDSLVETYISQIIDWVEKEIEALDICKRIGLCTDNKAKKVNKVNKVNKIRIPKNVDNDLICTVCQQVVAFVETLMTEEKTEEEIIALVEKLCDKIPAPYGSICDSLAEAYIPQIMAWLKEELEVLDICQKIGLCSATAKARAHRSIKKARNTKSLALRAQENGLGCDVCKDFIQWVEKELKTYTVPALWKLVSVDCAKVPYLCKFCAIITESDIETILNLILNKLPPAQVCSWIKIC